MSDKNAKITASQTTDAFNEKIMNHSERLATLEERSKHLATKQDLETIRTKVSDAINAQTWKIIGAVAGLVAAVYFIAK